ncbi:MAG: NOP5/NOP56 family protein [archaeon]|nr:NOP58 family protein [Nanoarchaeota archaeon]
MSYIYSNIIGSFILGDDFRIVTKQLFKTVKNYQDREKAEKTLLKKYPKSKTVPKEKIAAILELFKDSEYYSKFYQNNILLTKQLVRNSVNTDNLILQTISNIDDLDKTTNILVKRLRSWYSLTFPELEKNLNNHEKFAELVATKSRKELLKELKLKDEDIMGAELEKVDLEEIKLLATNVHQLYILRDKHEEYLKTLMEEHCPNLLEIAGVTIGAKLFEHAKSLRRLALLPSSTIQLLGAEKALFRHIKTGAKSPKYGVLFTHPLVQKARPKQKGMIARTLASKISIAVRVDFFRGKPIGKKLREELESRFGR